MSIKSNTFIFKHQYKHKPGFIDESSLTTPDLVLSMRDVYKKYVLTGSIEGLGSGRPLVQDDRLFQDFPEETVDSLMFARELRDSAEDDIRKMKEKPEDKPEEKPEENPEDKPEDNPRDIPKD